MINGIALVTQGIEEIAAKEIEELISCKCDTKKGAIIFKAKKMEDLALLAYRAQSVNRVLFLIGEFDADKELNDTIKNCEILFKEFKPKDWLNNRGSFKVVCDRSGNHNYGSSEIASKIGEFVWEKCGLKVDLDNPLLIIYVAIMDDKGYLGIDVSGFELDKRQYKVFGTPHAIKATIAYSAVRLLEKNVSILDPFCGPGVIPIEAALFFNHVSPRKYQSDSFAFKKLKPFKNLKNLDFINKNKGNAKIYAYDSEMPFVSAAKKNAKIAGVNKFIKFGRLDMEWLDTKFDKESLDAIITVIPHKNAEKLSKELFYQAEFVLRKGGIVVVISDNIDKLKSPAEKYNFKLMKKLHIPRKQDFVDIGLFIK